MSTTKAMPAEVATPVGADESAPGRSRLAIALVVALAICPVVVGGLSLIGDTWLPVNDWSHMVFRTSQVGTSDTPLVGPYSVHGWAHPGPLIFWVAAPLYRLTGEDARSLLWMAAAINCATIAALAAVAWRRGRWPLLLAVMTVAALLVHGLGPEIVDDLWNPYAPLLPFLLTVFLVWDAALGRRRALIEAILPASFAAQSHVAFVPLVILLLVWLAAWLALRHRIVPAAAEPGEPREQPLSRRTARYGLLAVGVLWIGPLLDALFDLHNPVAVAQTLAGRRRPRVGMVDAVGVVGRYARPDGPWVGGRKPESWDGIVGSGPLPLLVTLALLAACLVVARRRGWFDVAALATLALVLTLGAVQAASRVVLPAIPYLVEWLSVIGGLVWFTVGWTLWRLVEPHVSATPTHRRAAAGLAAFAILGATATSWLPATRWVPARTDLRPMIDDLRADLAAELPKDVRYRVEVRGDRGNNMPGLIYWMIEDGYDVVTADGDPGLKWGHEHRWSGDKDDYDTLLVVAADMPQAFDDAYTPCAADPDARLVADYDSLTAADRAWLRDVGRRAWASPDDVTEAERQRADRMEAENLQVGVFVTPRICGE